MEAVAYIAEDDSIAPEQKAALLDENLTHLCEALDALAEHALIPREHVAREKRRLNLPSSVIAAAGPVSAPPSLLVQIVDIQRAIGRQPPAAAEAAAAASVLPPVVSVSRIIGLRVYDAKSTQDIDRDRLRLARREGEPPTGDPAVDETYDAMGITLNFFAEVYDAPLRPAGRWLEAVVHYGSAFDNTFWDGTRLIVGDGDGKLFGRFSACLDIIAHELSHELTSQAALKFVGQSGALSESICDVFGILVKQWHLGMTAESDEWVIGAGLFLPSVHAAGLRSLALPGTAYDDPVLGKDPQGSHMREFVTTPTDNGGVHINCGIPNNAFFKLARSLGGSAWEGAGLIWHKTVTSGALTPATTFAAFGGATVGMSQHIFGDGSVEADATRDAWLDVGVTPLLSKRAAAVIEAL